MNYRGTSVTDPNANSNPIEACVVCFGLTLVPYYSYSRIELPENVWTRVDERPIECKNDSTAPAKMPRHSIMGSKRLIGAQQFADDGSRLAWYAKLARTDPQNAVKAVLYDTDQDLLPKPKAAEWLFARLVSSRSVDGAPYFDAVRQIARPEQVAETAVNQYRTLGNERRLALAASLLREYGSSAWPALRWIARSGLSDCEYFVDLIATVPGVRRSERIEVLVELLKTGSIDVKWGIVGVLENYPELRRPPILNALRADADVELSDAASQMTASVG